MIFFANILLQAGAYLPEIYTPYPATSSGNGWLVYLIGAILTLFAGGALDRFILRKQRKLKEQAEGEESKHKADKEGASTALHEATTQQQIRQLFDEELTARLKQISLLREEKANIEEKRHKAESEALNYKKDNLRLEKLIEKFNSNMEKIQNSVCPDCKKIFKDVKD